MAVADITRLRSIALVGQGGTGKTQLAEALLFTAGAVTRLGRPDDGTAVMDFEPEELSRQESISSAFHHLDWKKSTVILADTPGYSAFLPDTFNTMHAVDGLVLVVSPGADSKVETEKIWAAAAAANLPAVAFVSRLDRENAKLENALADLNGLGAKPAALTLPIGTDNALSGVIDVLNMKALRYSDNTGKAREEDLSGDLVALAEDARTKLCEAVAESDDALLEKYLEEGKLENEELRVALRVAVLARKVTPVLSGSGSRNIGVGPLLDAILELLPSPADTPARKAHDVSTGEEVERAPDPAAPVAAQVFKTVVDPFAGKLSIFRVVSGKATSDTAVLNSTRDTKERFGQLLRLEGKKQSPLDAALPGEIAAVAKLKDTSTGDTLCDEKAPIIFPPLPHAHPVISFAIRPKSKGDEEKASQALARMIDEDPSLEMHRDPQTHDIILSGTGQLHIEVAVERLKRKYNVEVELQAPKVPYKETIKGKSESQGKYKRQSGGRGQYGDCWLRLEPLARGGGFEFVDAVVGGSVPRQFIPSVEKGVRNTLPEGFLAGYPLVDLKVTLYDGSSHAVDSSDMSFQIAASMGLKAAVEKARPILLEPIMSVEVSCPDECMGDVIGDLNSRRGKVLGVERKGNSEVIKALVPMAEILKYAPDLRSITSGRGSFESQFSHYEEAPAHVAEKVIKDTREAKEAAKGGHAHA
jgi:elongation factor G